MPEENREIILTDTEVRDLTSSVAGKHFIEELELMLVNSRMHVDTIEVGRLPTLQGRISAIKSILNILGK